MHNATKKLICLKVTTIYLQPHSEEEVRDLDLETMILTQSSAAFFQYS